MRAYYVQRIFNSSNVPFPKTKNYVVGPKSFRPETQKPRQMENAVRDI